MQIGGMTWSLPLPQIAEATSSICAFTPVHTTGCFQNGVYQGSGTCSVNRAILIPKNGRRTAKNKKLMSNDITTCNQKGIHRLSIHQTPNNGNHARKKSRTREHIKEEMVPSRPDVARSLMAAAHCQENHGIARGVHYWPSSNGRSPRGPGVLRS